MNAIAIILVICAVFCYVGQTFFNKLFSVNYDGPESKATAVFSSIYGIVVALGTFAYNGFKIEASTATILFAIGGGIAIFFFNLGGINAARTGPYAFQSLLTAFGTIVLPLFFGAIFWNDRISTLQIIGLIVLAVGLTMYNSKGFKFDGVKKGYFFWVGLLFMTNGIYGILMDAQQRASMQTQRNEMIIIAFGTLAVISVASLLITDGKDFTKPFKMSKKPACFAVLSSVCAATAVNLQFLAMKYVLAVILYAVVNGGILIIVSILSVVVLKEKLSKFMVTGLAICVVSIVLLGL